jgi:hypothetical protein
MPGDPRLYPSVLSDAGANSVGGYEQLYTTGTGANATITLTFPFQGIKIPFLQGLLVTGLGATVAAIVSIGITGVPNIIGLPTFYYPVPLGPTVSGVPMIINFPTPLSGAFQTPMVITIPGFGAGNTYAAASAWGFRV